MLRASTDQVRETGRNAQGVKLVALDFGDAVTAVARVVPEDERVGEGDGDGAVDDSGDAGDAGADGEEQIEIAPEE